MTRRKTMSIVTASVATVAAVTTIANAQNGEPSPTPPSQKPVTAAPAPAAQARFGVLGKARSSRDVSALHANSFAVKQHGINIGLSRRIGSLTAKTPTWLVPSADGLCLFSSLPGSAGPSGGCGSVSDFEAGYATTSFPHEGGLTTVVGVVPDGVTSVTLTSVGGAAKEVAVSNNGFEVSVDNEARSVSWVDPVSGATISSPITTTS